MSANNRAKAEQQTGARATAAAAAAAARVYARRWPSLASRDSLIELSIAREAK